MSKCFLSPYEAAAGATIDREAFRWWLTLATLRWGVICRFQAERHLSGQSPSVELAAIGRRVSETEWDVPDLLDGGQERWGHSPRERGAHPLEAQGATRESGEAAGHK